MEGITIDGGRYIRHEPPENMELFSKEFPHRIESISCKGKFIYWRFSSGWNLWNTLGMTGGWTPDPTSSTRIIFHLNDKIIYFNDSRNFGTLKFSHSAQELDKKLKTLGPDVLQESIKNEVFVFLLQNHKNKTLPEFLMNQKILSGVGNYIKAEALYLSGLSPHRLCGSISPVEASRLNQAIFHIVRDSYTSGGSTFKTYKDFNGEVGSFSERFMVYNRKTDPVGRQVIKEETLDGRTTFWVPEIQK